MLYDYIYLCSPIDKSFQQETQYQCRIFNPHLYTEPVGGEVETSVELIYEIHLRSRICFFLRVYLIKRRYHWPNEFSHTMYKLKNATWQIIRNCIDFVMLIRYKPKIGKERNGSPPNSEADL